MSFFRICLCHSLNDTSFSFVESIHLIFLISFLFIRLKDLQAKDDAKFANEHAKNLLESHIFNLRDKLDSDVGQLLSTEEEREKIQEALSEASDWLDDEGWDSTADVS